MDGFLQSVFPIMVMIEWCNTGSGPGQGVEDFPGSVFIDLNGISLSCRDGNKKQNQQLHWISLSLFLHENAA
jgi:hypothetical protein